MFNILGGQYSDGIANIDVYLEGYSGGSLQQDRVTREPIVIPRANLGITVTVQPSIIDAVGSNEALNNRGLVARFLIAIPPNNVGFRDRRRVTRVSPTIERTYAAQLRDIADRTKQRPLHLTVGEEATRVFADWDQEHEDLCQPGQRYEDLASTIGKMRANIQRIAALLHVAHAHDKVTDIIGADVMADAITIGNYFLQHRVGLQAQWGTDGVALQARSILEWAIRNERTEFTRREMMRGLKRRFADVESTVAPLRRLVECGWLRASGDLAGLKTASQGTASLTLTMHPHAQQYIEVRKHEPSVSPVYPVSPKDVFSHTSLSQTKEPSPPRPPGDTGDTGDTDPIRRSGLFDPEP